MSSQTTIMESVAPSQANTIKDLSGSDTPRLKRKRFWALCSSDEDTPPSVEGMRVGVLPSFLRKSIFILSFLSMFF